jgi:hypothetical protein
VAYLALLEFLGRNRIDWMPPSTDETVVGERRPPGVGRVRAVGMVARFVVEDVDQEIRGKVAPEEAPADGGETPPPGLIRPRAAAPRTPPSVHRERA